MSARRPRYEVRRAELAGRGAPVAMLHGFLGRPSSFDAVVAALPERGPIALAELPGHGPDPLVMEGAPFEAVAEALLDALPFAERTWLVGYSMGARLALAMALARPDAVAGAVLVGANPGLASPSERKARSIWDDEQAAKLEREGLARYVDAWEALPLFATQTSLPDAVRARQRAARLEHTEAGLAWAVRALGLGRMPPLCDAIERSTTRFAFVAGSLDAKFAAIAVGMARRAPRGRAVLAAGYGHNVGLEGPAALARAIEDAMARAA
jgi:2-succinyl-6-hydroxy-2,4-cyclohexadiene-1-carboxylate synthase